MNRVRCGAWLAVAATVFALNAQAQTAADAAARGQIDQDWLSIQEDGSSGPVDYGFGPGVPPPDKAGPAAPMAPPSAAAVPPGGADAHIKGAFWPPPPGAMTWPLIALHAVLLPDGRVMSYGTDAQGQQGAGMIYDVWDPTLGTGSGSHLVLENTTATDLFCSGQSVISASGEVLITGGDLTIDGQRNYSTKETTIFNWQSETVRKDAPMWYARWYPTVVSMANGDKLVLGGRQNFDVPAPMPEVYRQGTGWRKLSAASSDAAYGWDYANWYYPRAFLAPNGKVFVLSNGGGTFYLSTAGNGTLTQLSPSTSASDPYFPALMYANGKVLSLRNNRKVAVVNLAGTQPTITNTQDIDQVRAWANATVLADGKVLVNGGSTVGNELTGVAYAATIWNPATGQWAPAATAAKARLYHSTSLLLPDGSVLTAGGGAPGPVNNLNAELYYPPYLFKKNGSGQPADRPTIISAQTGLYANQQFTVTVGSTAAINRVTLVRTGSVTHSFNPDQRFVQLSYTQSGQTLTARLPASRNVVPPGYYLLFVFKAGVPSVAKIIQIVG